MSDAAAQFWNRRYSAHSACWGEDGSPTLQAALRQAGWHSELRPLPVAPAEGMASPLPLAQTQGAPVGGPGAGDQHGIELGGGRGRGVLTVIASCQRRGRSERGEYENDGTRKRTAGH